MIEREKIKDLQCDQLAAAVESKNNMHRICVEVVGKEQKTTE